jgi:uncharacterized membrane protein
VFFAPFLFLYALIFFGLLVFWFFLVWVGVISGVFQTLGLSPELAFVALLASLIGSYINIPVTEVESGGEPEPPILVKYYGIRYRLPARYRSNFTKIAVNVGGAIVPVVISAYVLSHWPQVIGRAVVGTAIVALVVHRFARPVPGLGIATPMFVPPVIAALCAWLLGGNHAAVAYVSGVMGTLIGADLANLHKIGGLGAPVASIGGAGTFDGIFLTGIVAVLLA